MAQRTRIGISVATQVIIFLVGTVTVVLTVVGVIGYESYKKQLWNELRNELSIAADQAATGIALAIWNLDQAQIRKIMESAMQDQAVYGLAVSSGNERYVLGRDRNWAVRESRLDQFDIRDLLVATREIKISDEAIGGLTIYETPNFLYKKLNNTFWILVGSIVILDLMLILSLYLLLWRRILHPLKLIESYAVEVSAGRKVDRTVAAVPLSGEFDQVRNSIRKMVALLESRLVDLQDSNDRFWTLVSDLQIAVGIYAHPSGRVMFLNKKFTDLFGYTLADIPHADDWFAQAYPDPDYRRQMIDTWKSEVEDAIRRKSEVRTLPYTVTCKNQDTRLVEIGGVRSGEYLLAVFNDITERKRAEDEVRVYHEHLEDLVQQRTEELVAARDLAETANRAKSAFLANMSHELRTPLNSVIGFSRLMTQESGLTERQQHNIEIINRSGTHLLKLIDDILELSKIEAGKVDIEPERTDLRHLLDEVADMLRPRADQAGIELVVEATGLPGVVRADTARLRQVLLNLMANAVKFTSKGRVTLRALAKPQNGSATVAFSVSDTGIGIRPEDHRRIFEPFMQVPGPAEQSGTGLGLSISRQYVKMMGGMLAVESVLGEGATFSFTLMLPIDATAESQAVRTGGRITGVSREARGRHVLVADDIPDMRSLLRDLLAPLGMEVMEAADGVEARDLILEHQPDLVLIDWRMPLMNGLDVTQAVRQHGDIAQPKIIMLTANAYDENRKEAMLAGVDDFMGKPIDFDRLFAMIERLLDISFQREADETHVYAASGAILKVEDLSSLAPETRNRFMAALRELNPVRIAEILDTIRSENPDLAARIGGYVDGMQYRYLWRAFGIMDE